MAIDPDQNCKEALDRMTLQIEARLKADLSALIGSRQEATERLDAMLSLAPLEGGGIDRSPMPPWNSSKLEAR